MNHQEIWQKYQDKLTRDWREQMPLWTRQAIPNHLWDGLNRYIVDRVRPGNFLCCVLSNDLLGAVRRGSRESLAGLAGIFEALVGYAPASAYGSPENVEKWLKDTEKMLHT